MKCCSTAALGAELLTAGKKCKPTQTTTNALAGATGKKTADHLWSDKVKNKFKNQPTSREQHFLTSLCSRPVSVVYLNLTRVFMERM